MKMKISNMRAKLVEESIKFKREGTPYEKLNIGHHGIKRALLNNPIKADSMEGDAMRYGLEKDPLEFLKAIDFNYSDPLAFTDYYSFDEDWYLENEAPPEVDYDEFQADFKPTGDKYNFSRGFQYQEGILPDGSKVIHYIDGLGSGYIAKKEWLK